MELLREIKRFRLPKEEALLLEIMYDERNYEYFDNGNDIFVMSKNPRRAVFRVNQREKTITASRKNNCDVYYMHHDYHVGINEYIQNIIENVICNSKFHDYELKFTY